MLIQRLALREGLALHDGGFRQRAVAPALGTDAAQVSRGVIFHLLFHDGVHLGAHSHGMRGAGVRTGRHGRHVAGLEKEEARRSGPSAAGSHVGHDGDGRGKHLLDGLAHRIHQPAGGIQADDQE